MASVQYTVVFEIMELIIKLIINKAPPNNISHKLKSSIQNCKNTLILTAERQLQ